VKALLGADAKANNTVPLRLGGQLIPHRRSIPLEDFVGRDLLDVDTVGSAAHMGGILPHRRIGVNHEEIHTSNEL